MCGVAGVLGRESLIQDGGRLVLILLITECTPRAGSTLEGEAGGDLHHWRRRMRLQRVGKCAMYHVCICMSCCRTGGTEWYTGLEGSG